MNIKKHKECNYCGSSNFYEINRQVDIRYFPSEEFTINKCRDCGILFTLPNMTINELRKYYPDSYGAYNLGNINSIFGNYRGRKKLDIFLNIYEKLLYKELNKNYPAGILNIFIRMSLNLLQKSSVYARALPIIKGKYMQKYLQKYLHIGSGNPCLFARYKKMGIEVHTIDINKELCEEYSKNGIISKSGTIEQIDYPDNEFDVIFFSHVIEHLEKPKIEVKKLCKWVKKTGFIVCSFPIYNTCEWNYKTTYYDVPRHRIHIDKKTAKMIFNNAGLKIVKKIFLPYGQGFHQNEFLYAFLNANTSTLNPAIYSHKVKLKYFFYSFLLSLINQSGNIMYYLKR